MSWSRISVSSLGVASLLSERDWEALVGLSASMSLATDVLYDAGMLDAKRLSLLRAAEAQGDNPADFARHLVKLSRARTGDGM